MNRDDIIRLAQEAGGRIEHIGTNIAWFEFLPKNLERFAALVAAAERERRTFEIAESYRCGWDGGVKAEREACAKLCDAEMSPDPLQPTTAHMAGQYEMAEYLGQAIRQRGENET